MDLQLKVNHRRRTITRQAKRGSETTQREKQQKPQSKDKLKEGAMVKSGSNTHSFLPLCYCELIPSVVDTTCVTVSSVQLSNSTDGVTTATMKRQRT